MNIEKKNEYILILVAPDTYKKNPRSTRLCYFPFKKDYSIFSGQRNNYDYEIWIYIYNFLALFCILFLAIDLIMSVNHHIYINRDCTKLHCTTILMKKTKLQILNKIALY